MNSQGVQTAWPGPRDARGLQALLVVGGFLGLLTGTFGSAPLFIWLSVLNRHHSYASFPFVSLVAFLLPLVPIVLGLWAWQGRRVRKFVAAYALVTGWLGLAAGLCLGLITVAISVLR